MKKPISSNIEDLPEVRRMKKKVQKYLREGLCKSVGVKNTRKTRLGIKQACKLMLEGVLELVKVGELQLVPKVEYSPKAQRVHITFELIKIDAEKDLDTPNTPKV